MISSILRQVSNLGIILLLLTYSIVLAILYIAGTPNFLIVFLLAFICWITFIGVRFIVCNRRYQNRFTLSTLVENSGSIWLLAGLLFLEFAVVGLVQNSQLMMGFIFFVLCVFCSNVGLNRFLPSDKKKKKNDEKPKRNFL